MRPARPAARAWQPPRRVDWRRSPRRRQYLARELTSVFLVVYALVLAVGLWRLSQGEAAFDAWRAALASPLAIVWHGLTLAASLLHAITWFQALPRTLPDGLGPAQRFTTAGWAATALATLAILAITLWGAR